LWGDSLKNIDNLCMNCFEELTNGSVCEECGYDNDTTIDMIYLQPKTVLLDKYVIGAVLSHESDAATYIAYDSQLDSKITIREFLPKGIANRLEGNLDIHVRERYRSEFDKLKASFKNLWTTIIKMRNLAAVIPTYDVFEANGTVYAVSEYAESITLREFLLRTPEGNITWEQARLMFMPVLTTLEALHENGIIHGGICPDNLVLCRDGKIRLSGFCIIESNTFSSDLEFNVNEGYTAIEQYENNHKICPATDIYAFSACIFRALVGQNPPDSKSREANDKLMIPNTIAEKIPTHVIRALGGGLQIYPEKRTATIEAFREQLNAAPNVVAASSENKNENDFQPELIEEDDEKYPSYPDYNEPKKGPKIVIAILVILIIVAVIVGALVIKNNGGFGTQDDETTDAVTVETYTVPDFISAGYSQSDIENNAAWNEQFDITFENEYSTEAEEGIIFKQSIDAGETVDEGTAIVLTVSKGIQTEEIPDVGGMTLDDATKELTDLGFTVTTVEIYNDGTHTEDTVRATDGIAPAAGTVCAVGEEVILQVYGEAETTTEATTESED
ncbi:MAG: PASTA domain-containing protein, partial [Clostridiales bacterium]|nr:PASTA domain-containing protein [Clostridiales bacterium]